MRKSGRSIQWASRKVHACVRSRAVTCHGQINIGFFYIFSPLEKLLYFTNHQYVTAFVKEFIVTLAMKIVGKACRFVIYNRGR